MWLMTILKPSGDRVVVPMAASCGNVSVNSFWVSFGDRRLEWGRMREEGDGREVGLA